jgi:hypothetical protein
MLRLRLGVLGRGQGFTMPLTRKPGRVEDELRYQRQVLGEAVTREPVVAVRLGERRRLLSAWVWVDVERGQG